MSDFLVGLVCTLLGLAGVIAVPVVSIVAFQRTRRQLTDLERRVGELEAQLHAAQAGSSLRATPSTEAVVRAVGAPAAPAAASPPETAPRAPDALVPEPPTVEAPAAPAAAPSPAASPPASPRPASPAPASPPPAVPRPPVAAPSPPRPGFKLPGLETLAVWIAATLGGLVLVVAVLFGLQLAIRAGYFGPALRFATGVGVGIGAWALAEALHARKYRVPSAALAGGAAAVLYAVMYAGHVRYGVIGNGVAMAVMVAVTAVTMLTAVRRDHLLLAMLAAAGGYLTPLLLSTGENKAVAFFAYLGLLDAGFVWAASRRRWWPLVAFAGVVTAALHVGWGASFRAPDQVPVALGAALLLGALFVALPARRSTAPGEAAAGALAALLVWLAGAAFVYPADPMRIDPRSSLPLAWSVVGDRWLVLAYVLLVPGLAAFVAGRRSGGGAAAVPARVWALVPAVVLPLVFVAGAVAAGGDLPLPVALAVVGLPGVVALGARLGRSEPVRWPAAEPAAVFAVGGGLAVLLAGALELPAVAQAALAGGVGLVGAVVGYGGARLVLPYAAVLAPMVLLPGLGERVLDGEGGVLFLAAVALYVTFAWPSLLRPRPRDLVGGLTAVLVGFATFPTLHRVWVGVLGEDVIGLLALLLGAQTLLGALLLVRVVRARADSRELALLVGVTLLFAALAVPLQLQEAWLTVGWAIEVVALAWVSRRLHHPGIKWFAAILAAAVTVRLLANPAALAYGGGEGMLILNWTLYTWGVPAVCLLVAAALLEGTPLLPRALRIASIALFFALVNLEVAHAFAHDNQLSFTSENLAESMTRSISWGVFGLVILGLGVRSGSRAARLTGFGFTLLAAAKVCLIDVLHLSGIVRVGSFAGLAVVLIIAAIVLQRVVLRERS